MENTYNLIKINLQILSAYINTLKKTKVEKLHTNQGI